MLELFYLTHFSISFGKIFASFTPAVGPVTTFWVELILVNMFS